MKQSNNPSKLASTEGLSPEHLRAMRSRNSILGTQTPLCQPQIEVNWHYSEKITPSFKRLMMLLLAPVKGARE